MKRLLILLVAIIIALSMQISVYAATSTDSSDFANMFDDHGAVMLIIEPESGSILYVNKAAEQYYGYSKDELLRMKISQINILSPEEISTEMQAAAEEERNYFIFKHKLANEAVRTVEVYSYPVIYHGSNVLFSIVYDITEKVALEERQENQNMLAFFAGTATILLLLYLLFKLYTGRKRLERSKDELSNFNELRKTFTDAQNIMVYLKDENFKYVFANKAYEQFCRRSEAEIIGLDDFEIQNDALAQLRRKTDLEVIEKEELLVDELEWEKRLYRVTKFPVRMLNGKFGVGAYVADITEEHEREKKQKKVMHRHMIIADVLSRSFDSREEQLDYVLNQSLELTESKFGYIYMYDESSCEFILNSWSKDVMRECAIAEKMTVYQLSKTGIWGEVVRQRKPIIINDFQSPNPLKKGYPEGHVALERFMSIPVVMDERIVAVVGLANKQSDYDENDIYEMTTLMSGVWYAVERKEAQEQLSYLSFHDVLTGLYNRRFFEHELRRLDTEENLPISIIMGDINGLKLTNDIFGHAFGDMLLQKVSDVLRRISRQNDIVARWGGDEFVLLLTKTDLVEAEAIIDKIKTEYSKEKVKAIKGSISMGAFAKTYPSVSIVEVLDKAEENMYSVKTLDQRETGSSIINMIMNTVHENCKGEKVHSIDVSELCFKFGVELNLPEGDVRKLKEAGYLHDIGKIIMDPQHIEDNNRVSVECWNDIKKHSLVGYRILNSFDDTADLAEIVLTHHEHWDGGGYPKGLKGEEIPLLSRIIAIAGSYDHLLCEKDTRSDRIKALEKLRDLAGTKLDPQLVQVFAAMIEKEFNSTP